MKFCESHVTENGALMPMGWNSGWSVCSNCGCKLLDHSHVFNQCRTEAAFEGQINKLMEFNWLYFHTYQMQMVKEKRKL